MRGVFKWGKTLTNLTESQDFEPMISVNDFLAINRIDNLDSPKILAINRPRTGNIRADFLRNIVYCAKCNKTLTSMIIDKRNAETREIIRSRYYYKCETEGCDMEGKSVRAVVVIDAAQQFFKRYLFVTKDNYAYFLKEAKKEARRKSVEFDSAVARLKLTIANKEKSYEQTKALILDDPKLKEHYDLDDHAKKIEKLKAEYKRNIKRRDNIKEAIPSFEEYLKLLETTPVILGKIRDMKVMDSLLRIFFSNFTIEPVQNGTFKGSKVVYKLNEPWAGFVDSENFVLGAGRGTLTPGLILGKDAL
jgi:hypothetical protein